MIKPCPQDENSRRLFDRGTEFFTDRVALTNAFLATPIALLFDFKGVTIHLEGSFPIYTDRGDRPAGKAFLDNDDVVDNEDGTVTIPAAGHLLVELENVTIVGTTNYDGTYPLLAASDANNLVITADYVAEEIPATAFAIGYRDAIFTSDGYDLTLPLVKDELQPLINRKLTALTGYVSIWAWR